MSVSKRIYVDQNIVSPFFDKPVDFKVPETCQIVFSPALLDDFKSASNPEKHLASLEAMEAIMVVEKPPGIEFVFRHDVDLHQEFSRVANQNRAFSFDTVRAHSSSGQHFEASRIEIEQALMLFQETRNSSSNALSQFADTVFEGILQGLLKTVDAAPPVEKGNPLPGLVSKNYDHRTAIIDIWHDLPDFEKEQYPTPELYFGFEAPSGFVPILFAMDMCCGIFDRLAYYAEPKRKKPEGQNNVQNDSKYIAYATQCDFLLSADKNLIHRAKAIFSHLGIGCCPIQVEAGFRIDAEFLEGLYRFTD